MIGVTIQQRIVGKFHLKLRETAIETYDLLKEVYGNETLSCVRVFECVLNVFKMTEKTLNMIPARIALPHQKQMTTSKKIGDLDRFDHRLCTRAITETVVINEESLRQIFCNNIVV
ncbi:hypothetical protein TNCV_4438911 [Trichonephila clavipes]|nr:hypothetical protein TNCV_4438911 [Trichonephila clavipes]